MGQNLAVQGLQEGPEIVGGGADAGFQQVQVEGLLFREPVELLPELIGHGFLLAEILFQLLRPWQVLLPRRAFLVFAVVAFQVALELPGTEAKVEAAPQAALQKGLRLGLKHLLQRLLPFGLREARDGPVLLGQHCRHGRAQHQPLQ